MDQAAAERQDFGHPVDRDGGQWSVAESKASRKKRRKIADLADGYPGVTFLASRPAQVQIKALQELALYVLTDAVAPTWLAVKNARNIQRVVIVMIPGLDRQSLENSDILKASTVSRETETMEPITAESKEPPKLEGEVPAVDNPSLGSGIPSHLEVPPIPDPASSLLDHVIPVKAPGDSRRHQVHSPLQAMLIAPDPQPKDKRQKDENSFQPVRTHITDFIHSADELRDADYPIHPASFDNDVEARLEARRREGTSQSVGEGWVDTKATRAGIIAALPLHQSSKSLKTHDGLTKGFKVFAIDCEMVLTDNDKYSLARISAIDWSGKTVLDKYVLPSLPIKNYFTQFSGITPEILEKVTTTLPDIQQELLALLGPESILLGHSLESDLNALKMTHPNIVDTAVIYPHPRGLPLRSSLKYLANKYLKREIQKGGANGHDSVEDARAVLDLVRLKCEKGPRWGTLDANGESIFRRISRAIRSNGASSGLGEQRQSAMVEYGTPERGFGKEATFKIACGSDDEIVRGVLRAAYGDDPVDVSEPSGGSKATTKTLNGHEGDPLPSDVQPSPKGSQTQIPKGGVDFIWARLRDLEAVRGWNVAPPPLPANPSPSDLAYTTDPPTPPAINDTALTSTLQRLSHIYTSLPPRTLLIVYNGTSDMRPMLKLQQLQAQYRREFKVKKWDELSVKWTDVEEQALSRAVDAARKGWALVAVR